MNEVEQQEMALLRREVQRWKDEAGLQKHQARLERQMRIELQDILAAQGKRKPTAAELRGRYPSADLH